jgi:ribosomal protein L40E
MIEVPKLVLIVLLVFVAWYAMRWLKRPPPNPRTAAGRNGRSAGQRRRQASSPRPQQAVEDLTACRTCGAYVAASAHDCGKPGCPQLR